MSEKFHNPFKALNPRAFPAHTGNAFVPSKAVVPPEKTPTSCREDDDKHLFRQATTEKLSSQEDRPYGRRSTSRSAHKSEYPRLPTLVSSQVPASYAETSESDISPASDTECFSFAAALRGVQPLKSGGRDICPKPAVEKQFFPSFSTFQILLEKSLEFSTYFSEEYIEGHVLGLDPLILQKMRSRRFKPEAHLDLHGFNARQALDALIVFMRGSWYKGLRTVLVIPGRGRNSPDGVGILRERVQFWLTQAPLKHVTLAYCTACPVDGGPGSLYVLLRKYKKKGKIYWERTPIDPDM